MHHVGVRDLGTVRKAMSAWETRRAFPPLAIFYATTRNSSLRNEQQLRLACSFDTFVGLRSSLFSTLRFRSASSLFYPSDNHCCCVYPCPLLYHETSFYQVPCSIML